MIKSSDIIELLKDKNADLSKEQLENIIEEELQKDENEMDADLIEFCLDALKEKEEVKKTKSKKYFTFRTTAYIAVAAMLVFVITAVLPTLNERDKILVEPTNITTKQITSKTEPATLASTTAKPSTTKSDTFDNTPTEANPAPILKGETTKAPKTSKKGTTFSAEENVEGILRKDLKINGFESVIFPKIIFENPEISSKNFEGNIAQIKIKSKEKIYNITIEKSSENFEEENVLDVNGLKVSVENENNSSEIRYRKNNLNYRIVFESSYEEAVRIAKTIC